MKNSARSLAFFLLAAAVPATHAAPSPELCKVLRSFVDSVKPDEQREFTLRTSWGMNFKDAPEQAFAAKRCEHNDYEPAMKVCEYLMENSAIEFAGVNVKDAITCLSKKTRFAPSMNLNYGSFSFQYGSDNQGALIDITLQYDEKIGGKAFRLAADGY
jgi:hypothetical protein